MQNRLFRAVSSLAPYLTKPPLSFELNYTSWADLARTRDLVPWMMEEELFREKLLSKLLTYPMTLSSYISKMRQLRQSPNLTVHVVGARAEADLPLMYWNELCWANRTWLERLNITFVGPQVLKPFKTTQYGNNLFANSVRQKYEELASNEKPEILYFCNSGIGHSLQNHMWKRLFADFSRKGAPCRNAIFTSFNEVDLRNDIKSLKEFGFNIAEVRNVNPMRSKWEENYNGEPVMANYASFVVDLPYKK